MQLTTGILLTPSPKILDVSDRFFGRKNVRLGVNGNAGQDPDDCNITLQHITLKGHSINFTLID